MAEKVRSGDDGVKGLGTGVMWLYMHVGGVRAGVSVGVCGHGLQLHPAIRLLGMDMQYVTQLIEINQF